MQEQLNRICGYRKVQGRLTRDANDHPVAEDSFREDDTCSYCGGLNPDLVLQYIREGIATIEPTDKSYKIYISWTTDDGKSGHSKAYFYDFNDEQRQQFVDLYNLAITEPESKSRMKFSYPGYFYTRPFFMAPITDIKGSN